MKVLNASCFSGLALIAALLTVAGCSTSSVGIPDHHQVEMDAYCTTLGQQDADADSQIKIVETFFSWKIHTCVQVQVQNDKKDDYFSYDLEDISHGFLRGPAIIKSTIPLSMQFDNRYGMGLVEGYWEATESSKDRQLISNISAHIECNRDERVCRERDGTLLMGILGSEAHDYRVASWDARSILADEEDDEKCGIGHRLVIDTESKSVVVNDYPKKLTDDPDCKPFQTANSYALRGGTIMIYSTGEIFGCTKNGVNSAIIAKVQEFKGRISDKTYDLWMDDGAGGKPATVKTPSRPFSQADCESAMQKKLAELKAD